MRETGEQLRIAIFTETFLPKIDGVVSILCLALQRLQEQGHKVILFGPPGGPAEYAGAEIVGVGGPPIPFYPELRINVPRPRVWAKIKEFQPNLIHLVNPVVMGPFGLSYAKRLNVPTLASFHTDLPRYVEHYGLGFVSPVLRGYLRTIHNQADINLCPSTAVRDDLRRQGFRRVRWWKRGIDTDLFTPGARDEAMRHRLTNGHPDDFLIVNVGRQSPEKGLKEIRDHVFATPGVRLAMIGGGPSHESLKEHYRDTPTTFPGFLRGAELISAYRAADAFIFPSTTETFGLVALEAMACRLPVIAAKAGGVVDTVIDGENGFFYDPHDLRQITPLIAQLRDNPQLREQMADNGYRHAQSRSWRATMDQLVDYYHVARRVFHQGKRPAPGFGVI
jgi:glycosyltransferase involved in cell wall biosynthesis